MYQAVHFDGFNIVLRNINGFTSCDFGCAKQYILMVLILRYKTSMVLQVVDFGCAEQYILMVLILHYKTSMVLQVVILGVLSSIF